MYAYQLPNLAFPHPCFMMAKVMLGHHINGCGVSLHITVPTVQPFPMFSEVMTSK
jgi:hypothetical protein